MQYQLSVCHKGGASGPIAAHFDNLQDLQRYLSSHLKDPQLLNIVITPVESEEFKAGRSYGFEIAKAIIQKEQSSISPFAFERVIQSLDKLRQA